MRDIDRLILIILAGGCTPKADPEDTPLRDECVFTDLEPLLGVRWQSQDKQNARGRNFLDAKSIVINDPPKG
jgi:hypothetical protein